MFKPQSCSQIPINEVSPGGWGIDLALESISLSITKLRRSFFSSSLNCFKYLQFEFQINLMCYLFIYLFCKCGEVARNVIKCLPQWFNPEPWKMECLLYFLAIKKKQYIYEYACFYIQYFCAIYYFKIYCAIFFFGFFGEGRRDHSDDIEV